MSTNDEPYNADQFPPPREPIEQALPETKLRPICPLCGCNTLVLFTPPKQEVIDHPKLRYSMLGTPEYIDWDRSHLYCCNGETDCRLEIPIKGGLTTPVKEAHYRFGDR